MMDNTYPYHKCANKLDVWLSNSSWVKNLEFLKLSIPKADVNLLTSLDILAKLKKLNTQSLEDRVLSNSANTVILKSSNNYNVK